MKSDRVLQRARSDRNHLASSSSSGPKKTSVTLSELQTLHMAGQGSPQRPKYTVQR